MLPKSLNKNRFKGLNLVKSQFLFLFFNFNYFRSILSLKYIYMYIYIFLISIQFSIYLKPSMTYFKKKQISSIRRTFFQMLGQKTPNKKATTKKR
jgi:hypothetical protein